MSIERKTWNWFEILLDEKKKFFDSEELKRILIIGRLKKIKDAKIFKAWKKKEAASTKNKIDVTQQARRWKKVFVRIPCDGFV